MSTSKFTDSQIMSILKQSESATPVVATICREHKHEQCYTFYKWRAKYCAMNMPLMARLRELEAGKENIGLKHIC